MSDAQSEWLTAPQAARMLQVSLSALRRWADKGEIPHWRTPGNQRRFSREKLLEWIAEREQTNEGNA